MKQKVRFAFWLTALIATASGAASEAAPRRLVLIDQDGSGPGGSNHMAMMVLLQAPC